MRYGRDTGDGIEDGEGANACPVSIAESVDMVIVDIMDGTVGDMVGEWSRPGLGMPSG